MISINNLKCYGSAVIVELIEREGDTCSGKIISVGTTSTIKLMMDDIGYFNYHNIDSEIVVNGCHCIAIQHYKIFGYKRPETTKKILDFEDLKTSFEREDILL